MIFKKKPIYIVGIILFTLILIADMAIFFLVPTAGNRGNRPGMGGGSFNGEMPEGFDSESFDPGSFGGQMPGGGNFDFGDDQGEMPEGFEGFGGQRPGNGEDFTMPEGLDSSNIPEGFDGSNMPNRGQMNNMSGVLSTIRSAFWPIAIVCVLGDALCIFMLIRLSKKKGNKQEDDDDDSDNPPRRDHTNTILAVIAVLLVGAVALTSLPNGETGGGMETQISVQQAQATVNDLASVFSGSGTLQSSDAEAIEIPSTVKITAYTVKNGDYVQSGDKIANVDKNAVLNAIYEVQSLIADMDEEIADVKDDTLDSTIKARSDGRIKAIYVQEGQTVAGAMYENGALILISLGGSMTVEIKSEAVVAVGQSLTVILSDETQIEGKVQQVRNGKITVTTTDDGPIPGDAVSVATEEGELLGTGTLEVSSPLKVTAFSGTVSKIRVKVGQKVTAGTTLLTLTDTQDLARYQQLLRERQELTEMVDMLNQIYRDGCIKADRSGIVSQIDADAEYAQLSASSDAEYPAAELTTSTGSYGIVLLSNITLLSDVEPADEPAPTDPPATDPSATDPPATDPTPTNPAPTAPTPTDPAPTAPIYADGTYAGKVTRVAYGALQIKISETDMSGSSIADVANMDETLFTMEKQYTVSAATTINQYREGQSVPSSVNAIQAGDKVLLHIDHGEVTRIDYIAGTGTPSQGATPGGNMQFPSGGGNFGYQQPNTEDEDEEEAVYEVETTSVCAITPADSMTIAVSVDELDILTLAIGQEATITLDALPGQSFSGIVKKINPTGTNEGGSTKYTVTMEVPRSSQMLPGMNASVLIEVSHLNSVLTVPAAAVQEDGNRTYVYTALDEKTGQPTKAVDVTTGSSDGTNIEILSGLTSGDTVYYEYADSIVYRFAN